MHCTAPSCLATARAPLHSPFLRCRRSCPKIQHFAGSRNAQRCSRDSFAQSLLWWPRVTLISRIVLRCGRQERTWSICCFSSCGLEEVLTMKVVVVVIDLPLPRWERHCDCKMKDEEGSATNRSVTWNESRATIVFFEPYRRIRYKYVNVEKLATGQSCKY